MVPESTLALETKRTLLVGLRGCKYFVSFVWDRADEVRGTHREHLPCDDGLDSADSCFVSCRTLSIRRVSRSYDAFGSPCGMVSFCKTSRGKENIPSAQQQQTPSSK